MTVDELEFGGARPLRGRLRLPGDKSISHRALLFAALADGRSELSNLATGHDVHATRLVLEHLGVRMRRRSGGALTVHGTGAPGWREPDGVLDCGNSGTTARVLLGALASRPFLSVLSGDGSLRRRPMRRVVDPLRAMGARLDGRAGGEHLPIAVRGGALHGERFELGVPSAQVKTALLVAGLHADGVTEVVSPAPSRDHSERMLAALGAPVRYDARTARVTRGAPEPFTLDVPGDPSSAAFFVVAASITPGSEIVLEEVNVNPTRLGFVDVLRRMGAAIDVAASGERCGEPVGDIAVRSAPLHGTVVGGDEIPNVQDEVPALCVAAAFADGVTEIRDAAELTVKESNRIGTIHQELAQLGIDVEPRTDGLVVRGGVPRPAMLKSHGDHRLAMAGAVAAHALDGPSTVRGWRAVAVSYPEFAEHLARLAGAP
jgi:3-phosphoshikimate 1-carboxyvinyltransferase